MRVWIWLAAAALATFLALFLWRGYPWQLALMSAAAVAALARASWRAIERLRGLYRPAEPPPPSANLP
ncbi:MAG: hypothetical protein HC897_03640 [Thermoanaerobaculia bacterium]|nr:hypothetical protein [Thermoanaerobaculia bacterium]